MRTTLLLLTIALVALTPTKVTAQNCRVTVGGPQTSFVCKFPFKFKGKTYNGCTSVTDPDGRTWCSTLTDSSGNHVGGEGKWGYCDERCPDQELNAISATTARPFSPRRTTTPRTTRRTTPTTRRTTTRRTTRSTTPPRRRFPTRSTTSRPSSSLSSDSSRGNWLPDPDSFQGECGLSFVSGFIVGGLEAKQGQFPFMALLGYNFNGETLYLCGGVLLNRRYVLTAAHCHQSQPRNKRIAEVVLGEWIVGQDPDCTGCGRVQRFRVSPNDVTVHEDWDRLRVTSDGNDLLLIRLPRLADTSLQDTSQKVMPICLPWKETLGRSGDHFIAGWGKTTQNRRDRGDLSTVGVLERTLRYARLDEFPIDQCKREQGFTQVHLQRHICAGGELGVDSCNGDSGGPLILRKSPDRGEPTMFLKGIVSYGTRVCGTGKPGVYINIEHYMPWITRNMRP